jgi:hypothetical protein
MSAETNEAAADTLRRWTRYLDWQRESFNTRWTMVELRKLLAFAFSEQGKWVHECMDSWPDFLLEAVLTAPEGAVIDADIVKRAGELAS